jgi:predicted DNA binding CopG/RHH family protein
MLKDQRMNIRITKRDLDKLKAKALENGMPYQTLVSSILHKYVTGKIKEG